MGRLPDAELLEVDGGHRLVEERLARRSVVRPGDVAVDRDGDTCCNLARA
jgi:hypothetical protein